MFLTSHALSESSISEAATDLLCANGNGLDPLHYRVNGGGDSMAVEIKVLQRGDDSILMNSAKDVFDNPIDPELTREFLADPRHHIAVAIDDGLVVGFASGVHYVHPDKPPELWINEVGLAPTYRRRGLGKALLRALFAVGRAHRCTVAWVLTDRSNVAAMALYESVGGIEGADNTGLKATVGYSFALDDKD
jgi:aminoglycoside 6'-N-acetyltransferase I